MKKITLQAVSMITATAAVLLLPAMALGATLTFDRTLAVGGITVASGRCPAATSGGRVTFDLAQTGTTRLSAVGNMVSADGTFGAFIKIPDNALANAGVISATCPDGAVVSSVVILGPFAGSVALPIPAVSTQAAVVPTGGVNAGGGGGSGNLAETNSILSFLFLSGAIALGVLAVRRNKYNA